MQPKSCSQKRVINQCSTFPDCRALGGLPGSAGGWSIRFSMNSAEGWISRGDFSYGQVLHAHIFLVLALSFAAIETLPRKTAHTGTHSRRPGVDLRGVGHLLSRGTVMELQSTHHGLSQCCRRPLDCFVFVACMERTGSCQMMG